jgi:hypothetical protein
MLAAKEASQPGEGKPAPEVAITERQMKSLISVRTNPSDAKIRVLDPEGKEVSSVVGQLAQTVEKGRYTIEASHPSYRTVTTDVSVASGQVYVVVVEMSQGAFLGFLRVVTDIPGASVYIDDKSEGAVGETPFGNVVPTGPHKLIVEKPGYSPIEQDIEVNVGDKKEINLSLERLTFGALVVKTNQGDATVFVNEKPVGKVPPKGELRANLPAGLHTVRASAEGMKDYTVQVKINGGQSTKLLVRFNPTPSRTSAWVSLGFSAALFISGGVLGGFALHDKKELDAERRSGTLASDDERIIRGFLFGLGADVSFGIGTLVGALSIYYFLRDPLPPSEGKKLIPVDFEENPTPTSTSKGSSGKEKATAPSPSKKNGAPPSDAKLKPRLLVAPLFGTTHAGLGLSVAF